MALQVTTIQVTTIAMPPLVRLKSSSHGHWQKTQLSVCLIIFGAVVRVCSGDFPILAHYERTSKNECYQVGNKSMSHACSPGAQTFNHPFALLVCAHLGELLLCMASFVVQRFITAGMDRESTLQHGLVSGAKPTGSLMNR